VKSLLLVLLSFGLLVSCDVKEAPPLPTNNDTSVIIEVPQVVAIPTPKPVEIEFKTKGDIKLVEVPAKITIKATPTPTPKPQVVIIEKPIIVEKEVVKPEVKKNLQAEIIRVASKYVGETESHGFNRSPFIDKINLHSKSYLSAPYCASFVSWVLYEAGVPNAPRSAWSPTILAKNNILFNSVKSADCFGLYYSNLKRIGHTGFIKNPNYNSTSISTIEANTSFTSVEGSSSDREGKDGVVAKIRNKKLMSNPKNKFSRYW
jgi:hypothetical protein